MAKNTRNYQKDEETNLKDTIQKLKNQVRKLRKNNRELKTENATLLDAWVKTESFLQETTREIPLEELINCNELPKKTKKKPQKTNEKPSDETKAKWVQWRKENI